MKKRKPGKTRSPTAGGLSDPSYRVRKIASKKGTGGKKRGGGSYDRKKDGPLLSVAEHAYQASKIVPAPKDMLHDSLEVHDD